MFDSSIAEAFAFLELRSDATEDEAVLVFGRLVGEAINDQNMNRVGALNDAMNVLRGHFANTRREFDELLHYLDTTDHNIFILGRAGTGKSWLLSEYLAKGHDGVAACAFTGVAARNIEAPTVHSLFRIAGGPGDLKGVRPLDETTAAALRKVKILIIDEISMTPGWLVDEVDKKLRAVKKNDRPFGGVRLVFVGDPLQLAPFVGRDGADAELKKWVEDNYDTLWFFDSNVFRDPDFEFRMFELTEVKRQSEAEFIEILDAVRENRVGPQQFTSLNTRVALKPEDGDVLTIATTNPAVEAVNIAKMAELPPPEVVFHGADSSLVGDEKFEVSGNALPVPRALLLKVGAQVMFTKNDDQNNEGIQKRWVNGTLGVVTAFSEDKTSVFVRVDDDVPVEVGRSTWSRFKYQIESVTDPKSGAKVDRLMKRAVAEYSQIPLAPAWAVTIHKSQGSTYDRVHVDLGNRAFAEGQTYVALSRVKTFGGLTLERNVTPGDVKASKDALDFIRECQRFYDIRKTD